MSFVDYLTGRSWARQLKKLFLGKRVRISFGYGGDDPIGVLEEVGNDYVILRTDQGTQRLEKLHRIDSIEEVPM